MKILHIVSEYWPSLGGNQNHCKGLSEELARLGHDVCVLTTCCDSYTAYWRFEAVRKYKIKENINGVEVLRYHGATPLYHVFTLIMKMPFPNRIRGWLQWQLVKIARFEYACQIKKRIKEFAPDITMILGGVLGHAKSFKIAYEMKPFKFVVVPCIHASDKRWLTPEINWILKEASGVLVLTPFEKRFCVETLAVDPEKISVVRVGVPPKPELNVFENKRANNRVLFLGRKQLSKGIALLLEAMKTVWEHSPKTELVLAGGRTQEWELVQNLIDKLAPEFKTNVVNIDDISETQKAQHLNDAACLVLPSNEESFGIVVLEAWQYKVPVVVCDNGVFRSFVENGVDGFLVNANNSSDMAKVILRLLRNPWIKETMGDNGYLKVKAQFLWPKVAVDYLCSYKRAIV